MKLTTFIRIAGLAISMAGLAFADNVMLYNTVNNATSTTGANKVSFAMTGAGTNNQRLVGQNISISTLSSLSPGPITLRNCFSCVLNFSSGVGASYVAGTPGPLGGRPNQIWTFASGGAASITGAVDSNNNGFLDAGDIGGGASMTLLSGTFLNSPTVTMFPIKPTDYRVAAGLILNSQNTQLNQFFFGSPLAGPVWTGTLNLNFNPFGTPVPGGGTLGLPTFTSKTIISGSLVNTSPVPEPSSILLFSAVTGFLGIGLAMRRRRVQ